MPDSSYILLSTAYLPPVQYITKFLMGTPVFIEGHENYQKQSYRNRCYIYGANGRQCLVIPVKKHHGEKTPIGEVEIEYAENWQKIHLKSLESAYHLSPFYEYYADEFMRFYRQKTQYLLTWNTELLNTLMGELGIISRAEFSVTYDPFPLHTLDYRQCIHPKERLARPDPAFIQVSYQQVFLERYGFIPNLSIIDLLFNEGPMAGEVLKRSVGSKE